MVDKKLLCEVLGVKGIHRTMSRIDKGVNVQIKEFGVWDSINIYELAHRCKEWGISKGYTFKTLYRDNGLCTVTISWGKDYDHSKSFNVKYDAEGKLDPLREQKATILACEYTLECTK